MRHGDREQDAIPEEELDEQSGEVLPERAAMTIVDPSGLRPIVPHPVGDVIEPAPPTD